MIIYLPYGTTLLQLKLPDSYNLSIIEPVFTPALAEPDVSIRESLLHPIGSPALSKLIKPDERVGIIFSDLTRPTPNQLILPEILAEIGYLPKRNITLFNALGSHRQNTQDELRLMLGDEIVDNYRVVQNDAFDQSTHRFLGKTSFGHDIWINRDLIGCDHIILTGFIEPHLFAGFSGGSKAIMPGMAGSSTILGNHSARMIAHPNATWGVTQGNPIYQEIAEIGEQIKNCFLVNVTLNKDKEITAVFSGSVKEAHASGCAFVKDRAMVPVGHPFDIVITTNSGFPLDLNLYQSVKGMSAAAKVVKPGGAIILAAECRDGLPDHGLYGSLLRASTTPADLLAGILATEDDQQDQWQAQIQAMIQLKADVYVFSGGLSDEQIRSALLKPVRDIEALVGKLVDQYGRKAEICILPEGPQTIPYVEA